MKKVICDFCNKETDSSFEYILPYWTSDSVDVKDGHGAILYRITNTLELKEGKKDVCPECKRKIASLLELVPNVKFENNDRTSMSISW